MGMGDVKLAAVLGLRRAVAPAMLIALAAGALVGIVLMPMHGPGARKQAIPFGPSSPSAGWSGCWRVKTCSTPTWTPTRAEQAQARPPIGR